MENRWANPQGYVEQPPPVRYRIRDQNGEVVEGVTEVTRDPITLRYYHALASGDQEFADEIANLIQRACAYFYAPDDEYEPLQGVPGLQIADEEISARIERLEQGENRREAERMNMQFYPLTELPFEQQRALVERIEAMKREWRFEILGEVETTTTALA